MAPAQPTLVMMQGPEPGRHYELSDTRVTTIGRSSRNSIRVATATVSRYHCEVACVNGRWIISDLNSRKGTLVNGEFVADKRVLRPDDIIRLSSTVFRFEVPPEAAAPLSVLPEEELEAERRRLGIPLAVNAAFLGTVVVAVALGVALALQHAQGGAPSAGQRGRAAGAQAARLYRDALKDLQDGRLREGLDKLGQVVRRAQDTPLGQAAAERRRAALWDALGQAFRRIIRHETAGEYADALAECRAVARLSLPPEGRRMLDSRRDYTLRLAHAAFEGVERRARQLLAQGRRQAAIELYASARQRLGVPELTASAVARITQLQNSE